MKPKYFGMMAMASVLALGLSGGVVADSVNPPTYEFTAGPQGQIQVGNAASECAQLGDLLNVEFVYSYKVTRNKYSPFSPLNLWLNGHKVLWQ